jgi:catechol 2,3-dioxygenase-like lactoylglutathione lyase family enzyme
MPNAVRSLVPFVHVRDVAASLEFYGKLGFAVANTFTPDGADEPAWAWLSGDGAELMIARATAPIVAGEQAVLFYLYVDDVGAKHAELRADGIAAGDIRQEFYAPRGEFRVVDPDGYTLMFTHTGT